VSQLYLGLGRVTIAHPSALRVRLHDDRGSIVSPAWALPFRYEAAPGDLLRVYGLAGRYWVVAIVQGQGRAAIGAAGDVGLRAGGRLRLAARQAVQLHSPSLTARAKRLTSRARTAREQLARATRWARRRLDERARERSQVVEEDDHRTARRSANLAEQAVKIDGALLQIGH
jgi:hypothetical protein